MAPVTAEYVPAKPRDEEHAYVDSNTIVQVYITKEEGEKNGGRNTFHSKNPRDQVLQGSRDHHKARHGKDVCAKQARVIKAACR